jgi:hypothetical protein
MNEWLEISETGHGKDPGIMVDKQIGIRWLQEPEDHDFKAAKAYLSLIYDDSVAKSYVKKLKRAAIRECRAGDILRASGVTLPAAGDIQSEMVRREIESGRSLSPVLLVRDAIHGRVIIAGGYDRLCAAWACDQAAVIPCRLV